MNILVSHAIIMLMLLYLRLTSWLLWKHFSFTENILIINRKKDAFYLWVSNSLWVSNYFWPGHNISVCWALGPSRRSGLSHVSRAGECNSMQFFKMKALFENWLSSKAPIFAPQTPPKQKCPSFNIQHSRRKCSQLMVHTCSISKIWWI